MKPAHETSPLETKLLHAGKLIAANRLSEARVIAASLAKSHSERHETDNLLGILAVAEKRRIDAMKHFERAVARSSGNAIYWQNLGKAYLDLDLLEKSLPAFGRALKLNPNLFEALWNAGELFRQIGQAETGLKYLEAALKLDPRHEQALFSKGQSLDALGRSADAEALYHSMLKRGIDPARVYPRLARARKYRADDALLTELETELGRQNLEPGRRSALHFALGKVLEDIGDASAAFESYARAHKFAERSFDIVGYVRKVDALVRTFGREYFASHVNVGEPDERPIFVVGMPRSGTTLTEQIAASHPLAHGAGELARIGKIAGLMGFYKDDGESYFRNVARAVPSDFAQLSAGYRGMMDFLAPGAKRIVDKMPHNFQHLGLIATLFPKARIIHCTRNPVDNCVSIFMNSMNEAHSYNSDLTTLGLYYRQYSRLMDHWRRVLSVPIFEMNYEKTTRDLEGQARKLVDFIGLPWDAACLKFNENKSTVQTLSKWQVRQPIYTTSVERWRKYEKHLGPLIAALGDLAA